MFDVDNKNPVTYTAEQMADIVRLATQQAVSAVVNLDNRIDVSSEREEEMSRMKQQVTVNGVSRWITGASIQDMMNSYLELCLQQGIVAPAIASKNNCANNTPLLGRYIVNFNRIYKSKQESLTKASRKGITDNHIIPKWGEVPLDKIKTSDLQLWFNELEDKGYSHETLLKIKNNMSPVLDAAVEDGYITRNPFKSSRLKIGGKETIHHKAIPKERMEFIRSSIPFIEDDRQRNMITLLVNTGMRMEEVLGVKWEDFDLENGWIYVQRAVVHPSRNMPEVKIPKTAASKRKLPLTKTIKEQLGKIEKTGFILHGEKNDQPLTYTEARYCFNKLRKNLGFDGYTAHDFRDTCATEWREAGIPMDIIARLLGHSKSDTTENRYVKYRAEVFEGVRAVMEDLNRTENGTK